MSIFSAIGRLIDMVKNMTKSRRGNDDSGGSDMNYSPPTTDTNTKDGEIGGCSSKKPLSSAVKQDGVGEEDNGEDIVDGVIEDIENILPKGNSLFGDDEDINNDSGKSFLEILFSFVLDPLTAIIKGIIQVVQMVITTINIASNLNRCAKWFVVYVFFTLIYIPISMLFALLNLKNLEKKIWNILYSIDAGVYCMIAKVRGQGFHIFKFSDDIREICFLESVGPTNCGASSAKKRKFNKKMSVSNILSPYLFLFVVILFVCLFIFYFGKFQKKEYILSNQIPISFGILFVLVTSVILFLIIPVLTSAFLYLCMVAAIPILLISISFVFYLFTLLYSKDRVYPADIYTWKPKLEFLAGLFVTIMELIVLFPNYIQYIIASVFVVVMFVFCLTLIYLISPANVSSKLDNTFFFSFLNLSEWNQSISNTINQSFGLFTEKPVKNKKQ
jgi:hypothetical protein